MTDRLGHDRRYAIDSTFSQRELKWKPRHSFEQGLAETIQWYSDNQSWWQPVARARGTILVIGLSGSDFSQLSAFFLGTTDELVEHVPCDLLDRWIATADQIRMKPWVSALNAQVGAVVGAIGGSEAGEVVVQSPAPLVSTGIEDPGPADGLVDCHRPVRPPAKG